MLDKHLRTAQVITQLHLPTSQNYTQEFYQACIDGDFELALCLLKMGVNLNMKFENGQNLLHIACMKNFYGLVQILIKFGCNEFMRDNFGRTALHYATLNNATSIVRYLVEKNTFSNDSSSNTDLLTKQFLNTQDIYGKTAIHLACESNFKEPILILLSSGQADLNLEENSNRLTPLMISYNKKHWEIFELLLKNGSNVGKLIIKDICLHGNSTALSILQRYFNNKSLACMIFDDSAANLASNETSDKHSYLYMAMKYSENFEFVSKLFDVGCKLNKNDILDYYNDIKMFKYLSKTITVNTFGQYFNKFYSYLEYVILLFKHYSFSEQILLNNNNTKWNDLAFAQIFTEFNLNFAEIFSTNKSNVVDYIILFYVSLVYEIFAYLLTLKIKNSETNMLNLKSRLNFLFAMVIFSSQLDCRKKFVKSWFDARFLTNGKLAKVTKMYTESSSSPWSLQALCRSTIRTKINNIDYVLNDKNLIKNLELPEIYVRYLKFEFI